MEQWIKTKGRLKYDPVRIDKRAVAKKAKAGPVDPSYTGFRKTHKARTLIVQLPWDDLSAYYRWFLTRNYGTCLEMQPPMWGAHVTVVHGLEKIPKMELWKAHEGETVELEYCPELIKSKWRFWFIPARSARFSILRSELSLNPNSIDLHITIARQFDWQPILNQEK